MHQIYSCSDENIEVFTTVIPSKVSSPARRRVKSSQHLLTKNVVIESDLYTPRPLELLPHRSDRRDGEGRRSGRLHGARQQGPHLAKAPARPVGISEPKSSNLCGNRAYGKSLIPPVARISVKAPAALEATATGSENGAVLTRGSRHLKKMTEEYPTLPQGAEASLPLTGSASCGVPSILRKMWTRHKKKSEYVGATNSAFEAD
ncbi:vexin [Panthera pardus]|nr:vexin [Panthera tigris]XP_014933205.1 vexin [Acinonyx jubatus]XP_019308738.1 vexin [Panthera pardus]XP_025778536.1 vexin [Puma concolor]XP_040343618.1 vexin [Puma yagouaroundi]XP_042779142.1 vexin [Panthera leo]XP_043458145.1 vexin [Prionailurus bengalensis]XP_047698536.1 vexin [Prionailurus viverrinus]XP_049489280.1 vexin [Panthera uncia]XP_058555706.1 vexin [Neofelis nebulosa]